MHTEKIDTELIRQIVSKLLNESEENVKHETNSKGKRKIPVEASGRHVHLSQEDIDKLFGKGYQLTPKRYLSQPGEFLCEEKIKLVTEKSAMENIAIIGPSRAKTQVEISITDARSLGIKPVVRLSGDLNGAQDIFIIVKNNMIKACESVIVAKNHIHMQPKDAEAYGVKHGQEVDVYINSERPIIFKNVVIRVNDNYRLMFHIDYDEANACNFTKEITAELL